MNHDETHEPDHEPDMESLKEPAPPTPPEQENPADSTHMGLPARHPLSLAVSALEECLSFRDEHEVHDLASMLDSALRSENFGDPDDPAAMLAAQSRVLDAVFNTMLIKGMGREKNYYDHDYIAAALKAQRQCRQTFDTVKKRTIEGEKHMEKKKKEEKRTEERWKSK